MSDTVLQIMQPTNPVEPPYQYMMIDGCKVKVNYLPKTARAIRVQSAGQNP